MKVRSEHLGRLEGNLWQRMPALLGADDLRTVAGWIRATRNVAMRPVVFALGGHVIKAGCGPFIADLIRNRWITHIALNGAAAIHDAELYMAGQTSEDVPAALANGDYGYARETHQLFAVAAATARGQGGSLGSALAQVLAQDRKAAGERRFNSVLMSALDMRVPVTIHIAVGADTVHLSFQAAEDAGAASAHDFREVCELAKLQLGDGGLWCNVGSAVHLPEVLLKACAHAAHAGNPVEKLRCVNIDREPNYRQLTNVLGRPATESRSLVGCHSILLPLLHQMITEAI